MKNFGKMRTLFLVLTGIFVLVGVAFADGEWETSGDNIYNTNRGNVGIGTHAPSQKLEIRKDLVGESNLLILSNRAAPTVANTTGILFAPYSNSYVAKIEAIAETAGARTGLGFWTHNGGQFTERVRINNSGNVGIGTTSPSNKLDIVGGNVGITHTINPYLLVKDTTNNLEVLTQAFNSYGVVGTGTNHPFSLYTNSTRRLTIDTNGNVGIGTTSPSTKLQIDDSTTDDNDILTLNQQSGYASGGRNFIRFTQGTETPGLNARFGFDYDSYGIQFRNSNDDPTVTIINSGHVGIGTTAPQSKLAVNGTITAKEIKVTETGWSDFVFKGNYDLPSLNGVETYIKKNRHLPDIPSAEEVREQGLAVSEMFAKQMQKIEEMTLYLIELKKENDRLKERVALLEGVINASAK